MNPVIETLTEIAHRHLGIPTLNVRRNDDSDFHELSVWDVKDALYAAYWAGSESAGRVGTCDPGPAPDLVEAARLVLSRRERGDLAEAVRRLGEALARAA